MIPSLCAQLFLQTVEAKVWSAVLFACRQCGSNFSFLFLSWKEMSEPDSSSSSGGSGSDCEATGRKQNQGHGRPASVVSSATGLVVSHDYRKARKCLLCNSTSTEGSPLDATEEAAVDMALPWRSYEKVKTDDGDTVRVPSGKLCLICFNVYRALGVLVSPLEDFLLVV